LAARRQGPTVIANWSGPSRSLISTVAAPIARAIKRSGMTFRPAITPCPIKTTSLDHNAGRNTEHRAELGRFADHIMRDSRG
jgi:hypothetical protein